MEAESRDPNQQSTATTSGDRNQQNVDDEQQRNTKKTIHSFKWTKQNPTRMFEKILSDLCADPLVEVDVDILPPEITIFPKSPARRRMIVGFDEIYGFWDNGRCAIKLFIRKKAILFLWFNNQKEKSVFLKILTATATSVEEGSPVEEEDDPDLQRVVDHWCNRIFLLGYYFKKMRPS